MMLLESLIAMLIFSVGILAVIGMYGRAIGNSAEAKYRSDASMLANELIGKMWVSNRTPATLQADFQGDAGTGGSAYTAFTDDAQAALPGVAQNWPTVTVDPATSLVTVVVRWKSPNAPAADPAHAHTVVAQVK